MSGFYFHPRFYFHLVSANERIIDSQGGEATDLEEARAQAIEVIEELRKHDPSVTSDWSGWALCIADGSGTVLARIDLDRVPARAAA
jgi:hypothetical protein